jgi:hypothetical protein
MPDDQLLALGEDIEKHGQRDPCVLYEGTLLDGKSRWNAAELLGIEVLTREFGSDPNDGDDPIRFVFSKNALRRHLTYSERCIAADAISALSEVGRPKENSLNKLISQDEAAKEHNVSVTGVKAARTIREAVTGDKKGRTVPGADKIAEDVKTGKKTIQKAASEIRAKKQAGKPVAKPKSGRPKKREPAVSIEEVRAQREQRRRRAEEQAAQGQRLTPPDKPVVMFGVQLWPVSEEERLKLGHYDYDQLFFACHHFEALRSLLPKTDPTVLRERLKHLWMFVDRRIPEPCKTEMNHFIAVYHHLCDLYHDNPNGECHPPFDPCLRRGQ